MRCTIFIGLVLLPLCMSQYYELHGATVVAPAWTWGQKISSEDRLLHKIRPRLSARHSQTFSDFGRSARPFLPFSDLGASAGPTRRRTDGTIKSRTTKDTLPILTLTDGLEEGFTTLDVMQKEDRFDPRSSFIIKGSLGGLRPEEVFYADEDLIIIKGGGFHGSQTYPEPIQLLDEDSQEDEELYKWRRRTVPSLSEEYNGNIATVLAPPLKSAYWTRQPSAASLYYPFSLFLPSTVLRSESKMHMSIQPHRTLLLTPSGRRFDFKQSPRTNLHYDGPTRSFPVNRNSHVTMNYDKYSYPNIPSRNFQMQKYIEDKRIRIPSNISHSPSTAMWLRRQNASQNNIRIDSTKNKIAKYHRYPIHSDPSSWISLAGDTSVNYRAQRPNLNPDAEILPHYKLKESKRFIRKQQNNQFRKPTIKRQPIGVSIQRVNKPRL